MNDIFSDISIIMLAMATIFNTISIRNLMKNQERD